MEMYILIDEDSRVYAVGTNPMNDDSIFVGEVDGELLESPSSFLYRDGKLIKDEGYALSHAKQEKDAELNQACMDSILAGFDHEINGELYHFSFDTQAQFNFQGITTVFASGVIDSTMWTVKQDGKYLRIPITAEDMQGITLSIIEHKESNISKYRDVLMPLVESAETVEEVRAISWMQEI